MGFNVANPLHVVTGAVGLMAAVKGADARAITGGNHLQLHGGQAFGHDHVGTAVLPKMTYSTEQLNHLVEGKSAPAAQNTGTKINTKSLAARKTTLKSAGIDKAGKASAKSEPARNGKGRITAGGRKLQQYDNWRHWRGDRRRLPWCGQQVDRGLIPQILGAIFGYQTYGSAGYECMNRFGYVEFGKK